MAQYELTDETIEINGTTLYRIRALENFRDVRLGDYGGFVQGFYNLRRKSSTAWVYDNAKVYGKAIVTGQAEIRNRATIFENAKVKGRSCISGDCKVYGNAVVYGKSTLSSNVHVFGESKVRNGHLENSVKISGNAYVQDTHITGDLDLSGCAYLLNKRDIISILNVGESNSRLDAYRTQQGVEIAYKGIQGVLVDFKRAMSLVTPKKSERSDEPVSANEDYAIIKFIETRFGV